MSNYQRYVLLVGLTPFLAGCHADRWVPTPEGNWSRSMDPFDLGQRDAGADSIRVELIALDALRSWSTAPLEQPTLIAFGPMEIARDIDTAALDWFVSQQDAVSQLVAGLGCQYRIASRDALGTALPSAQFATQLPQGAPMFGYLLVAPGTSRRVVAYDIDVNVLRDLLLASATPRILN